jgi:amyloid beta precursor protein binding protein 1
MQSTLESEHVCLINAPSTGTEILKSLVLPGVGAFSFVDGKKVTKEDIGFKLVNYFVRNSDLISHRHNDNMV